MSRIFEALQKSGGPAAELMLPLAAGNRAGAAAAAPAAEAGGATAPAAVAEPPREIRSVEVAPGAESVLFPFGEDDGRAAEQYRIIRTKLIHHPNQPRVLAVTSPELGDGKSVTAANIAGVLSLKEGTSVVLIDADFRRSSLRRLLGMAAEPGLAEVLSGSRAMEDSILRVSQYPSLHLLPAGQRPANPAELLDSPAWAALCGELRRRFSFVIVDAPPIAMVADCELIQAVAEGVVVVVRPDHTHRGLCYAALNSIPEEKLIGVVMNDVPDWFVWNMLGHRSYEYYGRHEPDDGTAAAER